MNERLEVLVKSGFERLGLELRRRSSPPWRPPGPDFRAGTILDVGAADGTPGLYAAYPEAEIVAFDPIGEQLEKLRLALGGRRAELIEVALGSERAECELHIPEQNVYKSSLHVRTALTAEPGRSRSRRVQVRTLDELVREHDWPTPYVLKIDTEGHDLEVLRGAAETLRSCAVVYCETSLAARFDSGYTFHDLSEYLFSKNFDLVDVLKAWRGRNGHVMYLDCVWVPRSSHST